MYLVHRQNLTLGALELLLASHVVPELGLGANLVPCEDSKGEHLGTGVLVGRVSPAEDDVLPDLSN